MFIQKKKVLCIIELFAVSYRNIYCRYIKKGRKNLEVRVKVFTFAHAFRERGAVMEKRGIFFWRIRMKPLDLQSDFEREKQAILEEITIDKKK